MDVLLRLIKRLIPTNNTFIERFYSLSTNLSQIASNGEFINLKLEDLLLFNGLEDVEYFTHLFVLIGHLIPLLFPIHFAYGPFGQKSMEMQEFYKCHLTHKVFLDNFCNYISFFCGFSLFINMNEDIKKSTNPDMNINEFLVNYRLPLINDPPIEFKLIRDMLPGVIEGAAFYLKHDLQYYTGQNDQIVKKIYEGRNIEILIIVVFHLAFLHSPNLGHLPTRLKLLEFREHIASIYEKEIGITYNLDIYIENPTILEIEDHIFIKLHIMEAFSKVYVDLENFGEMKSLERRKILKEFNYFWMLGKTISILYNLY